MSSLDFIEREFQDFIFGNSAAIDREIAGEPDFRQVRLGIYYDAYRLRLTEVLARDYEALSACLGAEAFARLARKYLGAHPSTFRNVRWFGGKLADFLAADADYSHQPVLAELARLEWVMGLAFDAPDDVTLHFEDLAAVAPEAWPDLHFEIHPSVHLLELRSNAVAIWHAVKDETGEEIAPKYADDPTCFVVWRKDLASYFRSACTHSRASDFRWRRISRRSG